MSDDQTKFKIETTDKTTYQRHLYGPELCDVILDLYRHLRYRTKHTELTEAEYAAYEGVKDKLGLLLEDLPSEIIW